MKGSFLIGNQDHHARAIDDFFVGNGHIRRCLTKTGRLCYENPTNFLWKIEDTKQQAVMMQLV